jgi:hypothetical protein
MKFRETEALRAFFCFFFFFVSRDRALVKPVSRFWRVIRQNACFGPRRCLLGFRKIKISVFTPKIAKNPNFGALSMHFLWKTHRDRALVKPVGRFWRVIRQNACFGLRMCLFGFRKIKISVFTPKIAKNPNFGHLQCISYGKQKS